MNPTFALARLHYATDYTNGALTYHVFRTDQARFGWLTRGANRRKCEADDVPPAEQRAAIAALRKRLVALQARRAA